MKPLFGKPADPSDQRRGRTAQAQGALFESLFLRACRLRKIAATRIPDGCKTLGKGRVVRVRTDFDWIITSQGRSGLIDTKTVAGQRFMPSHVFSPHQVAALAEHADAGAVAGFVIWFREADSVCFMPVSQIQAMVQSGKGFKFDQLLQLGPIASFNLALIFNPPLLSTDPSLRVGS